LPLVPRGAGDLVVVLALVVLALVELALVELARPRAPLRLVVPARLLVRLPELGRVRLPPSSWGSSSSRASSA